MRLSTVLALCTLLLITTGGTSLSFFDSHMLTAKQRQLQKKLDSLDQYYSTKKLGSFTENGNTIFRIFAPRAKQVRLVTFTQPGTEDQRIVLMKDADGVWEVILPGELYGLIYGYTIENPWKKASSVPYYILDPYATRVVSHTTYKGQRLAVVQKEGDYAWDGDEWIERDKRDVTLYEMHVRDMTAHPTSGADKPGTYMGLIEKGKRGGIDYIKSLGVNTVELLPAQEFANIEIPYKKEFQGRTNTWNPYERNHWGYMTAAFFAPESYFAHDWKEMVWNTWEGHGVDAPRAFKDMVRAFHREGIAVVMDVVYNHLSEYELGNLKEIDHEYYFRLDANGGYRAESGCGNDIKTERPMMRRMIVESILYWMKEYHIDGFRFDLGKLIDWETVEAIRYEAEKINPNVIIVCEPWGGGYDPKGFSVRGWGAWNDQIRNGIKGENPINGHGWIFGKWYGNNNPDRIKSYVHGTLIRDKEGLFQTKEHSVNYLESHDGYTIGDFIRIATGEVDIHKKISNIDSMQRLTPLQMKLNKLSALFLFTSQGMLMIHSGQEYGRSKVIKTHSAVSDTEKGHIDHNSYNKDNETNYINYDHADANKELLDYYRGLFQLRNDHAAFRRAEYEDITFLPETEGFRLGYIIRYQGKQYAVVMNAQPGAPASFTLPEGTWQVLVNGSKAGSKSLDTVSGVIQIPASTGYVLLLED